MIAPIQFWLPAFFPCLVRLPAIYPFPRIPSPAASDFRSLLSYPTNSSGLEHSKPVQRCSQFPKRVGRLRGGS
jgi:hypothetical protein